MIEHFRKNRKTRLVSGLINVFQRALKPRERPLEISTLHAYVENFLGQRDTYLESCCRFGTPQYYFDEPALTSKIVQFKEIFSKYFKHPRIFYAMKSNSFSKVCRRAILEGLGLDVSSGMELSEALALGAREIVFSGPGKTGEELLLALNNREKVVLMMDSLGEFDRISHMLKGGRSADVQIRTGIRVHDGKTWSKLGIPVNDLPVALRKAKEEVGARLCGIQFHTSWNMDSRSQVHMIGKIGSCLHRQVPKHLFETLSFIDVGGGFWPEQGEWLNEQNTLLGRLIQTLDFSTRFGMNHYHRRACSLERFAKEISAALAAQGNPLRGLEVWAEPGRWISTSSMHIFLRVVDKKGDGTAITDGGTNLLGWERPLNEFIPVINLTRPSLQERRINTYGSLCSPEDIWGTTMFGGGIENGDILMIPDQGSYTYSLRQAFIKPTARVIGFDGYDLKEMGEHGNEGE